MNISDFFDKLGITNTVIGSAVLLFVGSLLVKKEKLKTEAETKKINTENFITKERFRKEELMDTLIEAEKLKEENKMLRKQLEESTEKIDKLIRRINILETFFALDK